jgi:DNA-binding MarR family transcriptional regulator
MPKLKNAPRQAEVNPAVARVSKQTLIKDLLAREGGATLNEMIAATGWLPHTTRAALTRLRKQGFAIDKNKAEGVTRYRHVARA